MGHPGIQVTLCCVIGGEDGTPRYIGDLVLCYRWGVRMGHPGIQVTLCCVIGGEDRTPRYTGDLVLCYRWGGSDTQVYR